ncbi:lambda-exonuclease family protein [Photobacterium aquae]|uniref:lambda-exonuclease family protein n=1 Tax=Photobacterium aquae TaxID=1195763 RepID=UPI00069D2CBE|nr:YqaJ viral recombinase family protein [Photobacterium aquae]
MAIVNLKQRTEAWKIWRNTGITASMIPVILGISPYQTRYQLWAELCGYKTPDDLSNNWHVNRGIEQEPEALTAVEKLFDVPFVPVCVEYDHNSLFKASLDGLAIIGNEGVEIKCPCRSVYQNIREQKANSIQYQLYFAQIQWQIMCANLEQNRLFVYLRGFQPIQALIKPDLAFIEHAKKEALAFWQLVETRTPPERTAEDTVTYEPTSTFNAVEWKEKVAEYRKVESQINRIKEVLQPIENKLNQLKGELADFIPEQDRLIYRDGCKVQKIERIGNINIKKLSEYLITQGIKINLDDFRGKTKTSHLVSLDKLGQPLDEPNESIEIHEEPAQIASEQPNDTTETDTLPVNENVVDEPLQPQSYAFEPEQTDNTLPQQKTVSVEQVEPEVIAKPNAYNFDNMEDEADQEERRDSRYTAYASKAAAQSFF